jgi:hypothetical protein
VRAGSPQRRQDAKLRHQARLPALCQVGGAVLALATLTCTLLELISAQQAIAMGLPAAMLVTGDLITASVPDPSTSKRLGFQVGLRAGTLVNLCRSLGRHRG